MSANDKTAGKKDGTDYNSIKPSETTGKAPTAVEWQKANEAAAAAATSAAALAEATSSAAAARALLARVKGAYATDPFAMLAIAAATQYVMRPGADPAARAVWADALLSHFAESADPYVKTLCLDQLRWCGIKSRDTLDRLRDASMDCPDAEVREFATAVMRMLRPDGARVK